MALLSRSSEIAALKERIDELERSEADLRASVETLQREVSEREEILEIMARGEEGNEFVEKEEIREDLGEYSGDFTGATVPEGLDPGVPEVEDMALPYGKQMSSFGCDFSMPLSRGRERIARGGDPQSSLSHQLNLLFKTARKAFLKASLDFHPLVSWCGHCKTLAPEYEKAATILSKHEPPVILAKVDANEEANKELASKYEVKACPTIKILRNKGKSIQDYKGPPEADGIVEYLKKQVGPASFEIKSSDDASKLIDGKKVFIVGVFPEFSGKEYENFMDVAEKLLSDYDFGHTSDAKLLPHGDSAVKHPKVRLFKPFDELLVDTQDFQVDALERFIEVSSVPVVTLFNKDPSNHPYVIKFFNNPNDKVRINSSIRVMPDYLRSCLFPALPIPSLFPFLYFMIRDLQVAKRVEDVGFYAGFVESAIMIGKIFTSILWGMVDDQYGRKPVIMINIFSV
ncbi:hypothetical protein J5N97_002344 [Dioscorea zingiberensis]|uniref:protein disulfide-isomerase n=1 Tax=Dioscorea zingiberensis TaxID=325984 RepID=A0A9D5HPD5_9LILI|nr:hypothetical protein J5N97_002344 [Dioscorea zingiberensis]